jgi:hypothetical protein
MTDLDKFLVLENELREYAVEIRMDRNGVGFDADMMDRAAAAIRGLQAALEAERRAREEAECFKYVPGEWRCAKCKLSLIASNMNLSGSISANNAPQQCPNNCGPMWRVTERELRIEAQQLFDREFERAEAAERNLDDEKQNWIRLHEELEAEFARRLADSGPIDCQCEACKPHSHASDCAVHNMPAYPNGPCNCGVSPPADAGKVSVLAAIKRMEDDICERGSYDYSCNAWDFCKEDEIRLEVLDDLKEALAAAAESAPDYRKTTNRNQPGEPS